MIKQRQLENGTMCNAMLVYEWPFEVRLHWHPAEGTVPLGGSINQLNVPLGEGDIASWGELQCREGS